MFLTFPLLEVDFQTGHLANFEQFKIDSHFADFEQDNTDTTHLFLLC